MTMITSDIAGYNHDTEHKCSECVRTWVIGQLRREFVTSWHGWSGWTTEELLWALAGVQNIDREYADSEDFPVPFSHAQAQTDASWAAHDGDNPPRCTCGNDFMGEF